MAGLTAGFLVLAGVFLLDLWGAVEPIADNPDVDPRYASNQTVRDPLLAPVLKKKHFEYGCNECHQNFDVSTDRHDLVAEHTEMVLAHGLNSRCLNCHNDDDWETLRDYQGTVVGFADSELLCRQCHGPKYRDWVGGAHGRPNGHWDPSKGDSVRATCVQCHDPHKPMFEPIAPAPAPRERHAAIPEVPHG